MHIVLAKVLAIFDKREFSHIGKVEYMPLQYEQNGMLRNWQPQKIEEMQVSGHNF